MDQDQDRVIQNPEPNKLPDEVVTPMALIQVAPFPVINEAQIGAGGVTFRVDPEDTFFSVSAVIVGFLVLYAGIKAINLFFDKIRNK